MKGEHYIHVVNFAKHQNPHKKEEPRFPKPPGKTRVKPGPKQAPDKTGPKPGSTGTGTEQGPTQDGTCSADSLLLKPDSLSLIPETVNPMPEARSFSLDDEFEKFWEVVHKKVSRGTAKPAFGKAVKKVAKAKSKTAVEAAEWITERMKLFAKSERVKDPIKGSLHPATWLNGERYDEDESIWNERNDSGNRNSRGQTPGAREFASETF